VLLRDRAQGGPKFGLAPGLQAVRGLHVGDVELDPQGRSSVLRQFEPGRGVVAKIDNRAEPLAAVYPREAEIDFRTALAGTDFSLQNVVGDLVMSRKLLEISVTEQERGLFRNVNNVSDVEAAIAGG